MLFCGFSVPGFEYKTAPTHTDIHTDIRIDTYTHTDANLRTLVLVSLA